MIRFIFCISFYLLLLGCSGKRTIIIDGVVQSSKQLKKLKSSEIFSYTKWQPGEAPPWYHKWDKTILIVVKTKKVETALQKQRHILLNRFLDSLDIGADILFIQDGIMILPEARKNLRKLSPNQLSDAYTMELSEANKLFGSVARPMTLILNTYDPNYKYKP